MPRSLRYRDEREPAAAGSRRRVAFHLAALLLGLAGCAANVPREPFSLDLPAGSAAESPAYLWTSGWSGFMGLFNLYDFATVLRVSGVATPDESHPVPLDQPNSALLIVVPARSHELEILYKEVVPAFCDPLFGCPAREVERHALEWAAAPGHEYAPFVTDRCGRNWYWIEDLGRYEPGGKAWRSVFRIRPNSSHPVAAGQRPPEHCSEKAK